MMQLLLIGERDAERTEFFMKTAHELSLNPRFIPFPIENPFQGFNCSLMENCAVKIDPPNPRSVYIDEMNAFGLKYSLFLNKLRNIPGTGYLNDPAEISHTLDKLRCKHTLEEAGIRTAPFVDEVNTITALRKTMDEKRIKGVFIKPRFGSGAAGIIALRRNKKTCDEVIYTTVELSEGRACNTRKQRRVRDTNEIEAIVNGVLGMEAVVEKWIPKASTDGKTYDLRVVWQFGRIACSVARLSGGTITNLHLGGCALDIGNLRLSNQTLYEIEELCGSAMRQFPGLNSAGIDILLEHNSLKPYIVEINGQGDLLYLDAYGENRIYKSQLMYLNSLQKE